MSETEKKQPSLRDFFVSMQEVLQGKTSIDWKAKLSDPKEVDNIIAKVDFILHHLFLFIGQFSQKKVYMLIGKMYVTKSLLEINKQAISEKNEPIENLNVEIVENAREILRLIDPQKAFRQMQATAHYRETAGKQLSEDEWSKFFIFNNPHYILAASVMELFQDRTENEQNNSSK